MAYTVEGLENGVEGCKKNIAVLEDAIEKERNTIKEYRIMMDEIETSDRLVKAAHDGIHVEVVNGDQE
jgi:hypothetical protein